MASINDTILIQSLADSYRGQLERYRSLDELVCQLMSRLVLSRGDLTRITSGFREKKMLIDAIEDERMKVADLVVQWEERKKMIGRSAATDDFENVLQQVTEAIRKFLDDEAQMQQYIEGIITRSRAPSV